MIRKAISFHSSRGGTGKTIIAVNLACFLAEKGLKITLIDLDFRAPSLYHIFKKTIKEPPVYWVNDYLNARCKPNDFLIDVYKNTEKKKGNLLVGFANPSIYAVEDMLRKSRLWEANALNRLFNLKNFLFNKLNVDLCIYDTSPGILYSSLNAIISSDQITFISSSDPLELEGVRNILKEFPDIFENKTFILLNKVFPETEIWPQNKQNEFIEKIEKDLKYPIIGVIPCYCEILKSNREQILTFKKPDHPFIEKLEEISKKLIREIWT